MGNKTIEWSDFQKVELRAGTIIKAEEFKEAKKPAYKVWVELGEKIGVKKSSAQITNYTIDQLIGKQVICVVNFKPKQIANFMSEVLVTGFVLENEVVLASVDKKIPNGTRLA